MVERAISNITNTQVRELALLAASELALIHGGQTFCR